MTDSPGELLDDFRDVSGWGAFTSGQVELALSADAGALRLDFDFKGGGGFAVARKAFPRALPASWALRLRIRGEAPANRFECKLVDRSGRSVWWHCRDAFEFPSEWRELRIRSSELEFAWGPAGGGAPADLGAIEFAIAAGSGGRGRVWLSDLRFEDLEYRGEPIATSGPRSFCLDFREPREFGALRIDWEPGGGARAFDVEVSGDAREWRTVYSTTRAQGARSHVYLPGMRSRHVRVALREPAGIRDLVAIPHDVARSLLAFLGNIARSERRGLFPRYLSGEQAHWTAVGSGDGSGVALLGEDGALEIDRAGFSLEPFVYVDGKLVTWADARIEQTLAAGGLPIPSSVWRFGGLELEVTPLAAGPAIHAHYRLRNLGRDVRRVRLFAALRPFQVTPPWQAFQELGGPSPIRELELREDGVWVNGRARVIPLTQPSGFGTAAFEQGGVGEFLERGELPARTWIRDRLGCASGALAWDLEIAAGGESDVAVRLPFSECDPESETPSQRHELTRADWQQRLGRVGVRLASEWQEHVDTLRTATAHILVNRSGTALHPGPRRYARAWIRDGAIMAAALLRMGFRDEVRDFLRGYAPHQAPDGSVPCCVDRDGPDWLAEHDSHGQFIFAVSEYFRFSRDRGFLAEYWPRVRKAAEHLEALRAQRLTPEYESGEKRARRGILPESVSHEGYMAHPVHAYWDDFWALRGLADAADLARVLADGSEARLLVQHDALRDSLYASIEAVIAQRALDFVPASVEWADHDPTATSMALVMTDAAARLPAVPLARTYDLYLDGFRRRLSGAMDWQSYTPYEIRSVGALVRLGRRTEAHELLDSLLADRRPRAWNQWPEIVWRDPKAPAHLGDLPHTWVAAEYVLAFLSLFAYECPIERALVIAAGIPEAWLAGSHEVAIQSLPTAYGALSYSLRRGADGALHLSLSGDLELPPGGIIVRPPVRRPLERVTLDGKSIDGFDAASVTLDCCPATVVMS